MNMDKKHLIDSVRRRYPNVKWFKGGISKYRVSKLDDMLMTAEQIEAGEASKAEKARLVQQYLKSGKKLAKNAKNAINWINKVRPDIPKRSDWKDLRTDILFCRFAYGFLTEEYLCFNLENKSMAERQEFVSDVMRYRCVYQMNDLSDVQIFNNKGYTYEKFKKYYRRDAVYIRSKRDFEKYRAFISKHQEFVSKAVYEGMGRGISLVDIRNCEMSETEFFDDMIAHGPHILEERVKQCSVLAALNESSVNTVRVITFNTREGIVAPYTFMKVGRKGSFVDNGGAGGIFVGIDKDTGMFCTDGFDEAKNRYECHPDSGLKFVGYQLPDWQQLIQLSKKLSAMVPSVKYTGWDFTHTDNGWVVIEGNGASQMIAPQIVFERGIRAEVDELLKKMDLIV